MQREENGCAEPYPSSICWIGILATAPTAGVGSWEPSFRSCLLRWRLWCRGSTTGKNLVAPLSGVFPAKLMATPRDEWRAWRGGERHQCQRAKSPYCRSPWVRADLFFLQDALAHGMTISEIAGFLDKTESEVRTKVKGLSCWVTRAHLPREWPAALGRARVQGCEPATATVLRPQWGPPFQTDWWRSQPCVEPAPRSDSILESSQPLIFGAWPVPLLALVAGGLSSVQCAAITTVRRSHSSAASVCLICDGSQEKSVCGHALSALRSGNTPARSLGAADE